MNSAERLRAVNRLLPLFSPCLTLEARNGRLWLVLDDGKHRKEKAAVVTRHGTLACNYGLLGMGSTRATAVAMLVRWVRDEPRTSIASWERWVEVGLARQGNRAAELLQALKDSSYGEKTGCVFCGSTKIVDWWSLKGEPSGPCCSHDGCPQRKAGGAA